MISKTDIQALIQCPRRLWLEHYDPEGLAEPDSQTKRRESDGNAVGVKAREALGPVIWPKADADKAVACAMALKQLADAPSCPAVEVPLVHDDFYARTDALIPFSPGRYVLQETKASSFPLKDDKITPAKPEAHHLDDVAIQAWVMAQAGVPMVRAELNLLNGQWRYPGGGDYRGLFKTVDVTEVIAGRMAEVPNWVQSARDTLAMPNIPVARTGPQCKKPHECPFKDKCLKLEPAPPKHPLTLLPGIGGKSLAKKLAAAGYQSILELEQTSLVSSDPKTTALYQRIQKAHQTGKFILNPRARDVIDALPYPRYFFDFEGIDAAIPVWEGVRPYQQIPFQWSCHIQRVPDGEFEHASFLDLSGDDPSLPCIEAMKAVIADDHGCVLVYHATYEAGRLKELAERHPEHAKVLEGWIERLVDLLPLVRDNFYHPVMEGSFSIKKVLKAMAPKMDYAQLEEIQEGTGAQLAYLEAAFDPTVTTERKAEIFKRLAIYCRQDTWAMVVVAYFLARRIAPEMPVTLDSSSLAEAVHA
jgi:hypothetical protein